MTYPLLRLSRDYALVEVRRGRGAQRWEEMTEIFAGPATRGTEWKGGEGEKLGAKHCRWPSDPSSGLSLPYTVTGVAGLGTGQPELLVFPSGMMLSFAQSLEMAEGETARLVLHEDVRSGNCYKIRLTAALLGLPLERRHYDIMRGETRTPDFLATVNANGRIPVLQVGSRFLPESNAACWYLAEGSALMPADRWDRADMLRWMFWEQYNHEPNIATLRFWLYFVGEANLTELQRAQLPAKRASGEDALSLMDEHLDGREWFAGGGPSLADISLYAYTHVSEAGGFRLDDFGHVCAWLKRVEALPGYLPMAA